MRLSHCRLFILPENVITARRSTSAICTVALGRLSVVYSGVFQRLPEPTKPTTLRPLLSLYGIIYVTWYTSNLPEATRVRLRLPNSHALLGSRPGRR